MAKNIENLSIRFSKIIDENKRLVSKPIFVITGLSDYIDIFKYEDNIADVATFDEEGNNTYFDKDWFFRIFTKLGSAEDFLILSHQQYAYIIENLNNDFFKDRVIQIYDNLRSLYPIHKEDYIEKVSEDGLDIRSDAMPIYQCEQFKIGEHHYYSLKRNDENYKNIPFFDEEKSLVDADFQYSNDMVIDVSTNPYAIDYFINECLNSQDFTKRYVIKTYQKLPLNRDIEKGLRLANHLLSLSGGGIFSEPEKKLEKEYQSSDDAMRLLNQYWGSEATFRNINVYENPDYDNTLTPISQGQIVDTIIEEYKNGTSGLVPRDIFITAPTGAGKSLLFQIPAFYAAEQKDITIVISPLKALMTDQVANLKGERGYHNVAYINSDLNFIDREAILKRCKDGDIDILYLSPESFLSYDIRFFIGDRRLGLLIIDEAHLITTWGRDFRVDYWFLGNHINKIRKYGNYNFPIVALTATAVYGGINDMVFDSISSLYMHHPHKFIGEVKRKDIEFVIDNHGDYSSGSYDQNKEDETLQFIRGIKQLGCKTLVYVPFKRHIDKIAQKANLEPDTVVTYHGGMNGDIQKEMYTTFRTNQIKVMVCTKAFGMGIDIPDIQCVYHHAPSGLLPDYIQEIGRAARKVDIKGFAALTFSRSDLRYSRQLFGISSLKTFQLRAVLQKIYKYFEANGHKRNMLISANDFAYIFNTNEEVAQKVSTALMMIEKDYLLRYRFNVLIARPKSLFSQVFARVSKVSFERLKDQYANCVKELWVNGNWHYILLNLDKIWETHFSDVSFPRIKNDFYNQKFLQKEGIELIPLVRLSFFLEKPYRETLTILEKIFNTISSVLSEFNRGRVFFKEETFKKELEERLGKSHNVEKLSSFILSTYSGKVINNKMVETDAFLQRRREGFNEMYQVFSTNYEGKFSQIMRLFPKLFSGGETEVRRYCSLREGSLLNYMRLGGLMEILNVGSFVSEGGEDPKIFIRINDPRRIKKDSEDENYGNVILESVKNRHKSSCEIFEHFFTRYMDNDQRWNFIEDFFLGESTEELITKYAGQPHSRINILEYISNNINVVESNTNKEINLEYQEEFKVRPGSFYNEDNLLSLGSRTLKISKWLSEDPVMLHRAVVEYNIGIPKEYYKILMNRLQVSHKEYYRDIMGLKLYIDFKGYDSPVQASVVYSCEPVKFYKWWKANKDKVTLSKDEMLKLFLNVEKINPKTLIKEHKQMISK